MYNNNTICGIAENNINSVNYNHIFKIYESNKLIETVVCSEKNKTYIFGRDENTCDIIVKSTIVSRRHIEISINDDICIIKNLGQNKIFVNDRHCETIVLKNGNNIVIDNNNMNDKEGILIEYIKYETNKLLVEKKCSLQGKNLVTVGRSDSNNIKIDYPLVSNFHLKFVKTNHGWIAEDCNSTNGTYLNGVKFKNGVILKNNDSIMVANTKFTFKNTELIYTSVENGISLDAINIFKSVKCKDDNGKKINKVLVDNISFSVKAGEFVCVVGGSGAGKSTLLDCLNGFRPQTTGSVFVNNSDLKHNYQAYKSLMGYVPQKDIVYDNLTVNQMLYYSAKLRLPKDSDNEDIINRVNRVVSDVMLHGCEDILIKKLSGGQKKRVSIAVELLANPKLLFLDEPSSGLDPGMDKSMMEMLSTLSKQGTTIVLITHATTNIVLCDKVVFLGYGGKLCYFGPPEKMLSFFGVLDIADIYKKLSINSDKSKLIETVDIYRRKLLQDNEYTSSVNSGIQHSSQLNANKIKNTKSADYLRQYLILFKRYFKLILSDKLSLFIMLGQAPLMVIILKLVSQKDTFKYFESGKQILFTISCMAIIMGILNSFLEICKERTILKREYSSGLSLFSYIISKISVLGVFCFVQSGILVFGSKLFLSFPNKSIFMNNMIEYWITITIALLASTSMGLLISSYSATTERATLLMPVAIIPQLVFSGVLFDLKGTTEYISNIIISKWCVASLGSIFDINILPFKITKQIPNFVIDKKDLPLIYEHTKQNLINSWRALIVFCIVCLILCIVMLKNNLKKD